MQSAVVQKFQVISDVHLHKHSGKPHINAEVPYLVIAGNLGYPNQQIYWDFLTHASEKYQLVFLVLGNVDYQAAEFVFTSSFVRQQIDRLHLSNVIFLDNSTFDFAIDDHPVRIIGTTLWSDSDTERHEKIQIKTRRSYLPFDTVVSMMHTHSLSFLETEIARCEADARSAVVITHYPAPVAAQDRLLRPPVIAWLNGHEPVQGKRVVNDIPCLAGSVCPSL